MQLETKYHPELQRKFDELARHLEVVEVSDKDIEKYTTIADPNDRHVLAGAEAGCADYLVTLDWMLIVNRIDPPYANKIDPPESNNCELVVM